MNAYLLEFLSSFVHLLHIIYWPLWLHGTIFLCVRVNQKQIVKKGNIERDDWPIQWRLVVDYFYCYCTNDYYYCYITNDPSIVMEWWDYGSLTPGLEGTNITQLSSVYFIFGFSGIPIQNSWLEFQFMRIWVVQYIVI